jgi:hypothetical protein
LEGADQVEFGAYQLGDCRGLVCEFLDSVFAEEALAGGVGFEDGIGGMHLADGHEGDFADGAVGAVAGGGDLLVEVSEVFRDGHRIQSYRATGMDSLIVDRASFPLEGL